MTYRRNVTERGKSEGEGWEEVGCVWGDGGGGMGGGGGLDGGGAKARRQLQACQLSFFSETDEP